MSIDVMRDAGVVQYISLGSLPLCDVKERTCFLMAAWLNTFGQIC
jgi:hypothetical protein